MKKEGAFTLIEILVVIAITAIVGVILVVIFANTLRGSNKSQALAVIKQNGQALLENLDKNIRAADNVVCVTSSGQTLVMVKKGVYTRYRIIPPDVSSNGSIQQDNPVQPTPPDSRNNVLVFVDNVNGICNDLDPLVSPVTLTDTNPSSGVSVDSGSFSRNQASGYKDTIGLSFILKPGISAPAAVTGQIDPVEFRTSIELR